MNFLPLPKYVSYTWTSSGEHLCQISWKVITKAVMCLAHFVKIWLEGAKLCQFFYHWGQTAQNFHWPLTFKRPSAWPNSWGFLRSLLHPSLVEIGKDRAKICIFKVLWMDGSKRKGASLYPYGSYLVGTMTHSPSLTWTHLYETLTHTSVKIMTHLFKRNDWPMTHIIIRTTYFRLN